SIFKSGGRSVADLDENGRLVVERSAAVDIVAYMVAVFLRREPGCRPLAGIDTQARPIDILVIDDPLAVAGRDVVAARVIRNFDDFPEGGASRGIGTTTPVPSGGSGDVRCGWSGGRQGDRPVDGGVADRWAFRS